MPIQRAYHNDHLIVSISGRFDARFIQDKRENLDLLLGEVKDVILFDLSNADFIDSSGIGFLVYMYKRIKPKKQDMAILGANGQPKDIIEMLRINRMISCVTTMAAYSDKVNKKSGLERLGLKRNSRSRFTLKRSVSKSPNHV